MADTRKTLEQLDGRWPEPDEPTTGLIERCHRLRRVPLAQLSPGDLRVLLGQDIGTRHILELAVEELEREPLVDADYYEGDLLGVVLGLRPAAEKAGLVKRLEAVLARARAAGLPADVAEMARKHGWI